MKPALFALVLTLIASPALAQSRTFYDASGRNAGRSVTDSQGSTTFYDASGLVSARTSTNGTSQTIYDARGRVLGRSTTTSPKGAGYYEPGYGYYDPGYAVTPGCYWQMQRFWDGFGWRLRNARVCGSGYGIVSKTATPRKSGLTFTPSPNDTAPSLVGPDYNDGTLR